MDYTNYDYQSLVDEITARLEAKEGWGEGYQSSTGQMLIQLFADSTDALMYMLERRVQEAFLSTALLDTSIFAHASELGYRPRRTVCSTGTVRLTVSSPAVQPIIIDKYTKVLYNKGQYQFITTQEAIIDIGETSVDVPVKEGSLVEIQYQTDPTSEIGQTGEILIEDYFDIDQYSIEIDDSGEKYFDVEETTSSTYNYGALSFASENDPVYDIKYSIDGMRIVFGDNNFGKRPSGVVTLRYVRTGGMVNPILATGLEFSLETDVVYDSEPIVPKREYEYTLLNETAIRGFLSFESVTDIAQNAPEYARANSRAVTRSDYEFWGIRGGIGGIVDVSAFGEQESESLIYNMNNVNMAYITNDEVPLTTEQEIEFREYMDRYKTVTTHIVVQEARKIEAVLNVQFKKESKVPMSVEETYKRVASLIDSYFEVKRGSIGGGFQHSELVRHVQENIITVNNVRYPFTDFVKIDMVGQYKLPSPPPLYDVRIYIDSSYQINSGDIFSVIVNGTVVSVLVDENDTLVTLADRMRVAISNNTSVLTSLEVTGFSDVGIRLTSNQIDNTITLNVSVGALREHVYTDSLFKIPSSVIQNKTTTNVILEGSASIIDSEENVIFVDNGLGSLVRADNDGNPIGIDYLTGELAGLYSVDETKDYYIRFSQDVYQNLEASEEAVIVLSKFAEKISDTPLYSKIEII